MYKTMDLGEAMLIWKEEIGGTITSWDKEDGYYCLFIKHNQVWGHTKASPGGIYWEWPNKLLEWRKKMEEKAREDELEEENYKFGAGEEWL